MNEKCLLDFKKCNGDWRNINNQACPTPICRFCLAAVLFCVFLRVMNARIIALLTRCAEKYNIWKNNK